MGLSGVPDHDRNTLSSGISKDAAVDAEAISDLETKLAAAGAEVKRLQHIEGKPLEQLFQALLTPSLCSATYISQHDYQKLALLDTVLASDALDALEAQTQESARLKARAEELEKGLASDCSMPYEAEVKTLTTHSSEGQASRSPKQQLLT